MYCIKKDPSLQTSLLYSKHNTMEQKITAIDLLQVSTDILNWKKKHNFTFLNIPYWEM